MRSPADRLGLERVLRVAGLTALVLWIVTAAWPRDEGGGGAVVRGDALPAALPRLTAQEPGSGVHVQLDTVPDARMADWLAALRHAGIQVSWSGASGSAIAIETFRSPDPGGAVGLIAATTPSREHPILSDALGPIDTIVIAGAPATLRLASVEGEVTLRSSRQPARVQPAPAAAPRKLFVSGAAGWEPKFVIAALEESGWSVDARLFVRPDHDVVQGGGPRGSLDTARYAAIVLMDSAAAENARGVEEFARAGGGVVLAGDANRARRVAPLVAWRAARRETAPLGTLPADSAWRGLSRIELDTVAGRRAVPLEIRDGSSVVAARRHYAGRVVGVGYDQTWRWRMAGGESALTEHREWWSRLVASVAMRSSVIPSGARDLQFPSGAAPLASLHDVLGPAEELPRSLAPRLPRDLMSHVLGVFCLLALLSEWLMRRARGGR
jgi:hypothetical protein